MAKKIIIVAMLCLVILAGVLVLVFSQGSCPDTSSCLPIKECYDRHKAGSLLNNTMLFSCSDRTGSVCCPAAPTTSVVPFMNIATFESKKKLLPLEVCGFDSGPKISVGQAASLGQFPWMALLSFNISGSGGKREFLCGGTLISWKYVLTAAHCLNTEHGMPVSVRLGEQNLLTDPDCEEGEEGYCAEKVFDTDVEKVIPHSRYNDPYLKNDIGLLRLKTSPPEQTDYIRPICLPFGFNISGEEEGKKYRIAGWGKIEDSSTTGSTDLLFASVDSISVTECDDAQTLTPKVRPIADQQLCAGGLGGQDACKGDSGGPLMETLLDKNGEGRTYQLGIVSFGSIPCGTQTPSVYTKVSAYLNWILSNLEP